MAEGEKGFLQRWSKRKLETDDVGGAASQSDVLPVAGRMNTEPPASHLAEMADGEGAPGAGQGENAGQAAAKMPDKPPPMTAEDIAAIDFDALDEKSDYTRFLQDGVPDWVRRKALNKLYMTNPIFNELDGLDYYDEDFTDAVWAVGKVETSYKVGRGFMSDEEVAEWEALGAPEEPEGEEKAASEADKVAEGERVEDREVAAADDPSAASAEGSAEQDEPGTEPDTAEEAVATAGVAETDSKDASDISKA